MSSQEKEPIFSVKNLKLLTSPFGQNNPITVQILGICSALAVTAKLKPAFVMALSVIVVTKGFRRGSGSSCSWSSWPRW